VAWTFQSSPQQIPTKRAAPYSKKWECPSGITEAVIIRRNNGGKRHNSRYADSHSECEYGAASNNRNTSDENDRSIAQVLKAEGFIADFEEVGEGSERHLLVSLKYKGKNRQPIINTLKRVSKPGLRVYSNRKDLPRVLGGIGIAIISTSSGIMTDRDARRQGVGGEVLCYIW
jgi:small subunit ribosomal protein S8